MRRSALAVAACLSLVVVSGCGIEGKWSLQRVKPTAARPNVAYEALTIEQDGTFYAQNQQPGAEAVSGTWVYGDGLLVLRQQNGERLTYGADLRGDHLILKQPWDDHILIANYKRDRH